jgi:hypothetical protein
MFFCFCQFVQSTKVSSLHSRQSISANGLRVAEVGDFGALNCQADTKLIKGTKF